MATEPDPTRCVVTTPRAGATLIVAGEQGVREMNRDGSVVRVLSRTPGDHPRFLPGGRRVAFVVPGRAEVRAISLDDCAEELLATLPRDVGLHCGGVRDEPYDPVERLESEDDVSVDPATGAVCLSVYDRNVNMASVRVVFDVDPTRRTESHFVAFSQSCGEVDSTSTLPAHRCLRVLENDSPGRHSARPPNPAPAMPYGLSGDRVVRVLAGGRTRVHVRLAGTEVDAESLSASGRWLLFNLNREEGDYIYRQLLLLDQRTGGVFRLQTGPWPAALPRAVLTNAQRLAEQGERATGETTLRWLDGDALLAGSTLITPGRDGVDLGGSVAY